MNGGPRTPSAWERQELRRSTWRRAVFLHPAVPLVPALLLALVGLLALGSSIAGDAIGWAFWLVVASPAAAFVLTIGLVLARQRSLATWETLAMPVVSFAVAFGAAVPVGRLWLTAAEAECGDQYECPF